jgi:hypothetical protein
MTREPIPSDMGPDRLLWLRSRTLRGGSLPISDGIEPVRLVFVRLRTWREEKLPR